MQVVCPNASCGAVYTVSPQHVGKSFPCRSCGTTVTVTGQPAPMPAAPAASSAPMAEPAPMSAPAYSTPSQGRAMQQQLLNQVKGDLFTYLLGAGVVILCFMLFLAILDQAKVGRKQAKVDEGQMSQDKEDESFRRRTRQAGEGVAGVTAPTADEQKAREKQRVAWQDSKADLQNEVKEASIGARAWRYWYTWGGFVGAVLVTIGSLAYVISGQSTTRRVTGAVILVFLIVTFLGAMIGKGPAITLSP